MSGDDALARLLEYAQMMVRESADDDFHSERNEEDTDIHEGRERAYRDMVDAIAREMRQPHTARPKKPNNPPTEADHLNAAGLFGDDLDRATRAIDKLEARGADRESVRKTIACVASCGFVRGIDVLDLRRNGFVVMDELAQLPKFAGVDLFDAVGEARVSMTDLLEAIEVAA